MTSNVYVKIKSIFTTHQPLMLLDNKTHYTYMLQVLVMVLIKSYLKQMCIITKM